MGEEEQKIFGNGGNNPYFPAVFSPENLPYLYSPNQNSINPFGFLGDHNHQSLESAFSRLNLSSEFQYQTPPSPLRPLPPASIDDLAVGEETGLGYYYNTPASLGYRGLWSNGIGSQDPGFGGGAHQNLSVGHGASSNYGGMPSGFSSGFRGQGYFGDSTMYNGNDSLRLNSLLNSGNHQGLYAGNGYSFLQSKKSSPRRLDAEFPNMPRSSQMENLDGYLNDLVLEKDYNFVRQNNHNNNSGGYSSSEKILSLKEYESLSLQDFRGKIVTSAKYQNGSRILQEEVENPDNEGSIEMIVSEVVDYVADLMTNQFGSYFILRLFGVCSEEQRTRIIVAVTKNSFQFVGICVSFHGGRTMQKLLDNLITPKHISFVMTAICRGVVRLANDNYGKHLVKHCVINCSPEYSKHLLNEVAKNCYEIAIDKHGCWVLQYCVENAHGERREHLIDEIIKNALHLAEDPYGNYVVQHLLSQKIPGVAAQLLEQLQYHFVALSCNKYASNVVDKFLTEYGEEHATLIIIELLKSPNAAMLLFDPYANYVIQKALYVRECYVYQQLSSLILRNAPTMRSHAYGKRILSRLEKKKTHVHTCTSRMCQ